jgi:hypothetical protein
MTQAAPEIVELIHSTPTPRLHGHFRVENSGARTLSLIGWALGTETPVIKIELLSNSKVVGHTVPLIERPDIAEAFQDIPTAAKCGFNLSVEAEGGGISRLVLQAELSDGRREPIGELVVRVLEPAEEPASPGARLRNRIKRW